MEAPVIQLTANGPPSPHGFTFATRAQHDPNDPNQVTSGNWDISTNLPAGWSATPKVGNEPQDFDVVHVDGNGNPLPLDLPNISLLQTAMEAACVEVKEVDQSVANASWITGDGDSNTSNAWDIETDFKRNRTTTSSSEGTAIGKKSRDVNMNGTSFWCIHIIGAYEYTTDSDGDGPGEGHTYGTATTDGSATILIYQEAIRDSAVARSATHRSQSMMEQITVLHEVLHRFDLAHPDGGIMSVGATTGNDVSYLPNGSPEPHNCRTANTRATYLLPEHIKKVQKKDYPR